ncbi:hypothetical protein [Nocardia seriolae]|uniref:hypothetical protein n=1 Tax=Nocardia seriolae TaxID=37332 RepID=UPI0004B9224D|nr:hypothetical protein [Nocardia seriolae]MTJ64946.1 hypothetical protein [Nocardia seriolae]MTJ70972.1 hypothetical protein [Nocardia seriolae]MTJ89763.1 hypothetical protein [Nocardia seriolae]MTK33738.1 hypothetical protein [Nocardia seriolae]MTK42891.1 hypothetical protein [Nocardia seriolae]
MRRVFGAGAAGATFVMTIGVAGAAPGDVSNGDPNVVAQQQIRQVAVGADIGADTWVFAPPAGGLACYWGYVPYPGHDAAGKPYTPWTDTIRAVGPAGWTERLDPGAVIETNCYMRRAGA